MLYDHIAKLFRAYNRRMTESAISNYVEFARDYDDLVVERAVTEMIDNASQFPTPAELKKYLRAYSVAKQRPCKTCNNVGWTLDERLEDEHGFKIIGGGLGLPCPCGAEISGSAPDMMTFDQARRWTLARVLAREVALRARGEGWAGGTTKEFAFYWWTKKEAAKWIDLVDKVAAFALVYVTGLLKDYEPFRCASDPYGVVGEIIDRVNAGEIPDDYIFGADSPQRQGTSQNG